MARIGQFKWVCLDCKAETWLERRELIRAARPRCSACGSISLEPSKSSEAKSRLRLAATEKAERDVTFERKVNPT